MSFIKAIASVGFLFASTSAFAATIQNVAGSVSLNNGSGFVPVGSGTKAGVGSMVLAQANSSAQIVYDNGCVQNVDPGTTVTVSNDPACGAGWSHGAGLGADNLLVGGLVAAGVVGGIVALASGGDSDDKPASP